MWKTCVEKEISKTTGSSRKQAKCFAMENSNGIQDREVMDDYQ